MSKVTVDQIIEIIEKAHLVKDANALTHDKPLSEQGVDPLDFSGVLFNIEEVLDIEIPDEDIDRLQTINNIVIYINNK